MKKEHIKHALEAYLPELTAMADQIYDLAEPGMEEFQSSKLLADYLQNHGFTVEMGIAGLPTAFRAVYEQGEGGPSFGFLAEYDALKDIGHACGHHMQGPSVIGAALALKDICKEQSYKIVVYGTPAEETIGGKIIMQEKGCFQDIDIALMMHAAPTTCVDLRCMALECFYVNFHGVESHAAMSPDKGKSAFDAALLSFQGIEFLREHVKEDSRMHYTVLDAGGPSNIVPGRTRAEYTLRSYSTDYLENGNIKNSVNYPACDMGVCQAASRIAVLHMNIPNMIGQITAILAAQGVNISDMTNKSRDKYAYTLLDLEHKPEETTVEKLKAIEGVLRVRVVK